MTKARTLADNFAADINGITAGTGITGGGTSGTVTVTNSMATAIDAKGDLVVGTGADTFARLAVGTDGHTLVADSSTATGLAYAAPAPSAMTLIRRATISGVANSGTTFDGVFSSSYGAYFISIEKASSSDVNGDFDFQLRYGGNTDADNYAQNRLSVNDTTSTITNTNVSGQTEAKFNTALRGSASPSRGFVNILGVGISAKPIYEAFMSEGDTNVFCKTFGTQATERTFDGFIVKASAGNITATIAVYGLAVA